MKSLESSFSITSNIIITRGTCAQAHEKELLECGTQLSVQLPAFPEGFPDQVSLASAALDPCGSTCALLGGPPF